MICYLTLGPVGCTDRLPRTHPLQRRRGHRWSEPYIQYCASKGIINGDGKAIFNPAASNHGCSIRKNASCRNRLRQGREYVGSNWAINAISDAVSSGILNLKVDYTAAATRDQVARYALNALSLKFQNYSAAANSYSDSTATVNTFAGRLLLTKNTNQTVNGVLGHTWQ